MNFIASPRGFYIPSLDISLKCALGKDGLTFQKIEGDGASPIGIWKILRVLYRKDKGTKPKCAFPISEITKSDGWCDEGEHFSYNQQVTLPFDGSHECLWRDDDVYDIIVILNHNTTPTIANGGSAIFMHIARKNYSPTEGCVALNRQDLERVLQEAKLGDAIEFSL